MTSFNHVQEPEAKLLSFLQAELKWSEEDLEQHLLKWQADRLDLLADMQGKWVRLNEKGHLVFESFPAGETLGTYRLLQKPPEGQVGNRAILWLNPENGKQLEHYYLAAQTQPGLLISPELTCVWDPAMQAAPYLPASLRWTDMASADNRDVHIDFLAAPEHDILFVALREQGLVKAFSLRDYEELESWKLRAPGSHKSLNLALDKTQDVLYMTDNVSGQLWIVTLPDLKMKVFNSGMGILGNLAPASTPGHIFLCILKPQFSVIYFETQSMQASYSVETKGSSWLELEQGALPQDPMHVFNDGRLIVLMTALEQGGRHVAAINVIDGQEIRTIRRYTLADSLKPVLMVRALPNPLLKWQELDFETWLLQQRLLKKSDLEHMQALEQAALEAAKAPPSEQAEAPKPIKKVQAARRDFRVYQPPEVDPLLWEQVDQPAQEMDMPAGAEDVIVDLINWAFYRLTLTNLLVHADEAARMRKLAYQLKEQLRSKKVVLAKLENVLGQHNFDTPIDRETVLTLLHQARLGGEFFRLEDLCPMCQNPLEEKVCPACYFRLSLPEAEALNPASFSAEPSIMLFPGQMLLPLPARNMLTTLNIWGQPLHQFKGDEAEIKGLQYAVALPNHNFLIVDTVGNRLGEYSPAGDNLWRAKLALKNPVMCTFIQVEDEVHYLVVDQGNQRVMELDASGRHHRRHPNMRTAEADKLKKPVDVHVTPQDTWLISDPGAEHVLEVGRRGEIVRRFGPEQGIRQPLAARRRADERTEILDGASHTWFLFGPEDQAENSFKYWPPEVANPEAWFAAAPPNWACRLHNGEWVLVGPDCLMLLAPEIHLIRKLVKLPDPEIEKDLLRVRFRSRSGKEVRQAQIAEHLQSLKAMRLIGEEPDDKLEYLARHVQALKFSSEQWLLRPNEIGSALFLVLEGALELIAPEEDQPVIFEVGPGELCGQQAVLSGGGEGEDYRPGLRAKQDSRVLMLERGEFKKTVVGFPRLFQITRQINYEHLRRFKHFRERKTEVLQDHLRSRMAENRMREFKIFAKADDAFFETLSQCLQARAYLPEQPVFGRLESGGSLFLIVEGQVGLLRKGETQPSVHLGVGDFFGEMSLLFDSPRNATVVTLDYCKFFELDFAKAQKLWEAHPWFRETLLSEAQARKNENEQVLAEFATRMGIDRPDLPQIEVQPQGLRQEHEIYFHPSLRQDVVFGFNSLGEVLWYWGREAERQLFQPSRITQLENSLLVADSGNDQILEIDIKTRKQLRRWRGNLSQPRSASLTPEGFLLVADEGQGRLVVIDEGGRELWTYSAPERSVLKPQYAEITPDNTILFADAGLHMVCEISREGKVLWSHGRAGFAGDEPEKLNAPAFVHRMEDGTTLVADTGNHRLVWLSPDEEPRLVPLPLMDPPFEPIHCQFTEAGDLLIAGTTLKDAEHDRLIKLGRRGELIWRVDVHFDPLAGLQSAQTDSAESPTPSEDRWILDIDRLDELQTEDVPVVVAETEAEAEAPSEAELAQEAHWFGLESEPDPDAEPPAVAEPFVDPAYNLLPELDDALDNVPLEPKPQKMADDFSFLDEGGEGASLNKTFAMSPNPADSPQDPDKTLSWDQALGLLDDENATDEQEPTTGTQPLLAPDEAHMLSDASAQSSTELLPELNELLDEPQPQTRAGGTMPLPDLDEVLAASEAPASDEALDGTQPLPEFDDLLSEAPQRTRAGGTQPLPNLEDVWPQQSGSQPENAS